MPNPLLRLFQHWCLLAVGVLLAAHIVPGIGYNSGGTLIAAILVLSLLNIFLKPLLLLFTLPFIVLTLGIGILVINALLFLLVGRLIGGFEVAGFGSAFLGGLIVSVVGFFFNALLTGGRPRANFKFNVSRGPQHTRGRIRKDKDDDDIIDI